VRSKPSCRPSDGLFHFVENRLDVGEDGGRVQGGIHGPQDTLLRVVAGDRDGLEQGTSILRDVNGEKKTFVKNTPPNTLFTIITTFSMFSLKTLHPGGFGTKNFSS
jgi:hypothetical protein